MNHIRFPKEDHLPDWARRDNKVTKGDLVEPLLPLRPVQNLSACTRVHFMFTFHGYLASEVAHPHIFRHFVNCTLAHWQSSLGALAFDAR